MNSFCNSLKSKFNRDVANGLQKIQSLRGGVEIPAVLIKDFALRRLYGDWYLDGSKNIPEDHKKTYAAYKELAKSTTGVPLEASASNPTHDSGSKIFPDKMSLATKQEFELAVYKINQQIIKFQAATDDASKRQELSKLNSLLQRLLHGKTRLDATADGRTRLSDYLKTMIFNATDEALAEEHNHGMVLLYRAAKNLYAPEATTPVSSPGVMASPALSAAESSRREPLVATPVVPAPPPPLS